MKKPMTKRALAAVTTAAMAMTAVGCGAQQAAEPAPAPAEPAEEAVAEEVEEVAEAEEEEEEFNQDTDIFHVQILYDGKYYDNRIIWETV